jgi:hypothetical protein
MILGVNVDTVGIVNEEKARECMLLLTVSSSSAWVSRQLALVAAVTVSSDRRPEVCDDLTLAAYTDKMCRYPPDVVAEACKRAADECDFFPPWKKFKELLDEINKWRSFAKRAVFSPRIKEIAARQPASDEQRKLNWLAFSIARESLESGLEITVEECKRRAAEIMKKSRDNAKGNDK